MNALRCLSVAAALLAASLAAAAPVSVATPTTGPHGMTDFTTNYLNPSLATIVGVAGGATGFRNRLINGGDQVDQRNAGAAQTITAGAALAYTDDRWFAYATGANVTGQRVAGSVAGAQTAQYRYQFTGASNVTAVTRCQRIATENSYDLAGGSAAISVDLADSALTGVNWSLSYANSTDAFGSIASPTVTAIASGSFTVSGTLARYYAVAAVPTAATTGLQLCLSVGAQASGTWTIGNAQLEAATASTPFERRSVGQEVAF